MAPGVEFFVDDAELLKVSEVFQRVFVVAPRSSGYGRDVEDPVFVEYPEYADANLAGQAPVKKNKLPGRYLEAATFHLKIAALKIRLGFKRGYEGFEPRESPLKTGYAPSGFQCLF